jgi:lipopolysaccharide/colanic/teichoic acid biosynthesis glycosyltransferase
LINLTISRMLESQIAPTDRSRAATRHCRRELLPEAEFLNVLYWEKRRSERSGTPFLLAVAHVYGAQDNGHGCHAKSIGQAVSSVIRETDTAGWYQNNQSLGIVFTELHCSLSGAQASIDARLKRALAGRLAEQQLQSIQITYHIFPEEGQAREGDPILYREDTSGRRRITLIIKRGIDVVGSIIALIALAPLLLLIALVVKCTSAGPVLCTQQRVGQCGRRFTLYKFRSMYHNSDQGLHREYVTRMMEGQNVLQRDRSGAEFFKIINDPRVTPVGKLLRRSSLDEIPQFFNSLRGEMSLVGPRPNLPYEFERYHPWHRRKVLEAKPGITGLWQVHGRSRTNFDEMVRLDLRYLREWSLWLDLKILLKTPAAVVSGVGAY